MADLRVVDVEQLEGDLTYIADTIRAVTGSGEMLQFPDDFANALNNLEWWQGGDY